jgi:hypothetical protein
MALLTTLPARARPDESTGPRPLPWWRMGWVTWRQHRAALAGSAALLVVMAVGLWVAGVRLHHAYAAAIACRPASSIGCYGLVNSFNGMYGFLANGLLLQAVPALIGAFLGAPLLARELETGTFRFAWTQGIGRWRWTLAKLIGVAVAVTAATGAITVLMSWYYRPYFPSGHAASYVTKELPIGASSPFAPGLFDLRGPTFAAWTLAAFAIGLAAGILIRRVVPAIVASLAAYAGLAFAAGGLLRQHYLAPLVTTRPDVPESAWVVTQQWFTARGRPASQAALTQVLDRGAPAQVLGKGGVPKSLSVAQYLAHHGYRLVTSYQPATRFWPFQWIETGWLLALSLLLFAVVLWLVRRRVA